MGDNSQYEPIPITRLKPGMAIPADIFLYIDNKYIRFKEKGDIIPEDKYDLFVAQNVVCLYVRQADFQIFVDWLSSAKAQYMDRMLNDAGIENQKAVETREEIKEKIYETFVDEELTKDKVDVLHGQVSEFVSEASRNPVVTAVMAKFPKYSQSVVEHSLNTANLALFLGMSLGHSHQFVLENIYLGAVFHDYGKAKIPTHIFESGDQALHQNLLKGHPEKGMKEIRKIKLLPDPVCQIILQHHEHHDGTGYPHGKKGDEIYNLARIVALANFFDNKITVNHKRDPSLIPEALKRISEESGKLFDPEIAERCVQAIKIGMNQ